MDGLQTCLYRDALVHLPLSRRQAHAGSRPRSEADSRASEGRHSRQLPAGASMERVIATLSSGGCPAVGLVGVTCSFRPIHGQPQPGRIGCRRLCVGSRPGNSSHHSSSRRVKANVGGRWWIFGLNGSRGTRLRTAGGILGVEGCALIGDRSDGGRNAGSDRDSALVPRSIFAPTTWLWFVYYFMCCAKYRSFGFVQSGTLRLSTTGTR